MTNRRFLIDMTDSRFLTPENADVVAFIRSANPFAHSDIGSVVFDAARQIPGAQAYCPSVASCAYVVLHTGANRIVAIAYGQRGLAVRLSEAARREAIAAGNQPAPNVGSDWVNVEAWPTQGRPEQLSAVEWMERAYADSEGVA